MTSPAPMNRLSPSLAVIFTPASRLTMYCRRGAGCQPRLCSAWVSRKITPFAGKRFDSLLPRRSSAHSISMSRKCDSPLASVWRLWMRIRVLPSLALDSQVFEWRCPRVRVDEHEPGLGHAGPEATGPDELVEGAEPHPVIDELLDLVKHGFALAPVGFPSLLPEQVVDVRVGAAGECAVAAHRFGYPRGGVAEIRQGAQADSVELLARPCSVEGRPLHRAHLHPDPHRAEEPDDRLARRPIGRIRIEIPAVEPVGIASVGEQLLGLGGIVGVGLELQRELERARGHAPCGP